MVSNIEDLTINYPDDAMEKVKLEKVVPFVPEHMYQNLVRRQDPSAPVEVGHRSATVCHIGNIAMILQRKLKWDPVAEEFPGDEEANRLLWRPYRQPGRL